MCWKTFRGVKIVVCLAYQLKLGICYDATEVFHNLWRVWHKILATLVKCCSIWWFYRYFRTGDTWHGAISAYYFWITFLVKFTHFCPFLNKFVLGFSSKCDVCDMLICPQNNNWPTANHPFRFLPWSLGLNWYQKTKNRQKYLSVLLKNYKMASKRDVCDQKIE